MCKTDSTATEFALRERKKNVCFSGHRPAGLPGGGAKTAPETKELRSALAQEIERAVLDGKVNFIHGMMSGFDIIAAESVLEARNRYPHIRLISAAPFQYGFYQTKEWAPEWIGRAQSVLRQSDFSIFLEERYSRGVYYRRNHWMTAHASLLLTFCKGAKGGTRYTVNEAIKQQIPVVNLADRVHSSR